ncbi:uncharacterized protein LY89DRAFT_598036, partial [Mollisia scopiformis]
LRKLTENATRSITLIVALATLTSNTLSSLLFAQLPDDPFHLANNFGWYLHFANILSVFGFIGALRQHPLSIAIFANYLILDTILCSIPRFLLLGLLNTFSSTLCSSYPTTSTTTTTTTTTFQYQNARRDEWSEEGCIRVVELAQLTLAAGVIAATVLQFVGALCVREYARRLWVKEEEGVLVDIEGDLERGEEARLVVEEERRRMVEEWGFGGLPVIREEREEKV